MEWFPQLRLGWWNGWIPLALVYAVFGVLLWRFPRGVVRRLYDRSGWSRTERIRTAAGKMLGVVLLVVIVLSPLKVGQPVFALGSILYVLGLAFFVAALLSFANTPPDRPVTSGPYSISRNPQQVGLSIAALGICFAVGSWAFILAWLLGHLSVHMRILAEERTCLQQYSESYRSYMQRVPRYLLFF